MRPHKKVKLADIAAILGVSVVTVSNALAGRKGVSPEMRKKIIRTAEQIGYLKKVAERRTAERQVALVVPDDGSGPDGPKRMLAARISHRLEEAEIASSFVYMGSDVPSYFQVIACIGRTTAPVMRKAALEGTVPTVGIGFFLSDIPGSYILPDEFHNALMAATWLRSRGCVSPAGVFLDRDEPKLLDRYLGFHHGLSLRRRSGGGCIPLPVPGPEKDTMTALETRLASGHFPDGIFLADASLTNELLNLLEKYQIERIPLIIASSPDQDESGLSDSHEMQADPMQQDKTDRFCPSFAMVGTDNDELLRQSIRKIRDGLEEKKDPEGAIPVQGRIWIGGEHG